MRKNGATSTRHTRSAQNFIRNVLPFGSLRSLRTNLLEENLARKGGVACPVCPACPESVEGSGAEGSKVEGNPYGLYLMPFNSSATADSFRAEFPAESFCPSSRYARSGQIFWRKIWCGRGESNPHGLSATGT